MPPCGHHITQPNSFTRPRGPTLKTVGGRPKRVAKRSSDKWMAQQDSTHAQAHCAAAITSG